MLSRALSLPRGWRFPTGASCAVSFPAPCSLPPGSYDLILLSEVLYFLDPVGIAAIAAQLDGIAPGADVVAVTWYGASGNPLRGEEALDFFAAATARHCIPVADVDMQYRIDVFAPLVPGVVQ